MPSSTLGYLRTRLNDLHDRAQASEVTSPENNELKTMLLSLAEIVDRLIAHLDAPTL